MGHSSSRVRARICCTTLVCASTPPPRPTPSESRTRAVVPTTPVCPSMYAAMLGGGRVRAEGAEAASCNRLRCVVITGSCRTTLCASGCGSSTSGERASNMFPTVSRYEHGTYSGNGSPLHVTAAGAAGDDRATPGDVRVVCSYRLALSRTSRCCSGALLPHVCLPEPSPPSASPASPSRSCD